MFSNFFGKFAQVKEVSKALSKFKSSSCGTNAILLQTADCEKNAVWEVWKS